MNPIAKKSVGGHEDVSSMQRLFLTILICVINIHPWANDNPIRQAKLSYKSAAHVCIVCFGKGCLEETHDMSGRTCIFVCAGFDGVHGELFLKPDGFINVTDLQTPFILSSARSSHQFPRLHKGRFRNRLFQSVALLEYLLRNELYHSVAPLTHLG